MRRPTITRIVSSASLSTMSASEEELGSGWTQARVVGAGRLRHPSGSGMEATYIGDPETPIFAIFHRPANQPAGVIVVCSPPYSEAIRNHRRELLFAWLASEKGLAVARFHPRGGGHSGGDTEDLSLTTMQDDARVVAETAMERFQSPLVGLIGTRLGAVVAHRVAAEYAHVAVAWWQPVFDAERYLGELSRARLIGDLKRGIRGDGTPLHEQLMSEGVVDVLGSPITRRFAKSLIDRPLDDAPEGPRRGLLAQMSRRDELEEDYESFANRLHQRNWTMSTLVIPDEETWWFGARGAGSEYRVRSVAMGVLPATVDFFLADEGASE
jgi:hypothetical protein